MRPRNEVKANKVLSRNNIKLFELSSKGSYRAPNNLVTSGLTAWRKIACRDIMAK